MEFIIIVLLTFLGVFTAIQFRKFSKEKHERKLLEEIEKDFIEDFSLSKNNSSNDQNTDFSGLIEWIEEAQLEDQIKYKTIN